MELLKLTKTEVVVLRQAFDMFPGEDVFSSFFNTDLLIDRL
jgi:hypothetical protein